RQALSPPIQGEHAIATAEEFTHDFSGVLFDEFAAAGQDDDRSLRRSAGVPVGMAQARATALQTGGLQEGVPIGRNVGRSELGRDAGRRGFGVLVNHATRRFGEGREAKPAENWAFWRYRFGDSLPFPSAWAIERSVAASSAKGRRRGNRGARKPPRGQPTAWLSARRLGRSGTDLASMHIVRSNHATALPTSAWATLGPPPARRCETPLVIRTGLVLRIAAVARVWGWRRTDGTVTAVDVEGPLHGVTYAPLAKNQDPLESKASGIWSFLRPAFTDTPPP